MYGSQTMGQAFAVLDSFEGGLLERKIVSHDIAKALPQLVSAFREDLAEVNICMPPTLYVALDAPIVHVDAGPCACDLAICLGHTELFAVNVTQNLHTSMFCWTPLQKAQIEACGLTELTGDHSSIPSVLSMAHDYNRPYDVRC